MHNFINHVSFLNGDQKINMCFEMGVVYKSLVLPRYFRKVVFFPLGSCLLLIREVEMDV